MKEIRTVRDVPMEEMLTGGTFACAGCNAIWGTRLTLKALGKRTIIVNTAGCMTLTSGDGFTGYKVPWIHGAIENGGSVAAGILHGLKAQGKEKGINVIVYAGDGATYDIGLQALSGMVARRENIIYVCYNNCSFANTGFQHSAATQYGARTLTTPPGKLSPAGNILPRKHMAKMMAAQGAPYVATACTAYPFDYMSKLRKAASIDGPKFIDLLTPCMPGWIIGDESGFKAGKLMVDSGIWPLYEIENGGFSLSVKPEPRVSVKNALQFQGRFSHLKEQHFKEIQKIVDKEWKCFKSGRYWEAEEY